MNLDVIEANRKVHSSLLLSGEYQKSPHRSRESVQRVKSLLNGLDINQNKLVHLDVGCGDGFMFECKPASWISHGVDTTPEMLKACRSNHPSVKLSDALAEKLPFPDSSFDVVTCYSFLDHLESTERFYSEAFRVLKPGGYYYFGLSPHREFYSALIQSKYFNKSNYLQAKIDLALEFKKGFDDGTYYEENFGINKNDLKLCEPGKSIANGLSPTEERTKLQLLGIQEIKIEYEWIVQQNKLDPEVIKNISDLLPFTSSCFKYFDLMGVK